MQDAGNLLPSQPIIGNSSMAAVNTVSDQTGSMTGAGSASEQTADVTPKQPMVELPAREGRRPVMVGPSSFTPTSVTWKGLD